MNKQKQKGSTEERRVAKVLSETGHPATRVVGSGAFGIYNSALKGDVQQRIQGKRYLYECKRRKNGFATLERWMDQGDAHVLIVRKDHGEALYIMRESIYLELIDMITGDDDEN